MAEAGYVSRQVVAITGLTKRQLDYWRKTGLIVPSCRSSGGHARYTFSDLIALKAAKKLIDAGVSVQRVRKSITALLQLIPTLKQPLSEVSLVVTGDVVLVFRNGTAFDALSGQEWVLPVAELVRDIESWNAGSDKTQPLQTELFPLSPEDPPARRELPRYRASNGARQREVAR